MKKKELHFCNHQDCKVCTETTQYGFEYIETHKDEKYIFEMVDTYTLVFLLKGKALITCNEFDNVPIEAGEAALWPVHAKCAWTTIADTASIVLQGDRNIAPCDRKALKESADSWLTIVPSFKLLPIKPRLREFLLSVKNYLLDGITCPYMHKAKARELSTVFRAYYSPEELTTFFFPTVCHTHEFEWFVMNNYLKMKGVKEFVDLSGMNVSTFNRKFKSHFNESPYQWLIKQKSKHIHYELSATDKNFSTIAKEFHFTDSSHFNRYCKTIFGASPSEIRKGVLNRDTNDIEK